MKKEVMRNRGIRLTEEHWKKLDDLAHKNKCTVSDVIRFLVGKAEDVAPKKVKK